nr:MAG TPA: hypothetical protein [Caudoviricetes sp.]
MQGYCSPFTPVIIQSPGAACIMPSSVLMSRSFFV